MPAGRFDVFTVFRAVDKMTAPVRRINRSITKALKNTKIRLVVTRKEFARFARFAKRSFMLVGAAAVAGMGLAARSMIKSGMEFEQAITNVGAVSMKSRDQIAELEAQAKELGRTTMFTATQSAQAMEILAKAGFTTNEILAATPAVLDAAAASGLEMAEVAGIVSNSIKGFGLEATTAADIADVLALASSRTNSTIGSLGQSIANVAATAKALNVPFNDVVTSVALLQDVGLDASVAGSSLNTMMTKLGKITPTVAKQLKKAGVEIRTAEGNMIPLPQLLKNFAEGAKNVGGELDVVGFFADLVGLRGQKAALALQRMAESGKFDTLNEELAKAGGSAEKMAAIRMDTLQGDVTKLGSALEGLKIDIFGEANSNLRKIVQNMTKWVGENNKLLVAMAGDPFGPFREAVRIVEDLFLNMARFGDRVNSFFGSFAPGEQAAIKTVPSQAEVDAQRAAEDATRGIGASGAAAPQVVPPQERGATNETREVVDVTLRDQTGRAEVKTNRPKASRVKLPQSGSFSFAN